MSLLTVECYFESIEIIIPSMDSHTEIQLYDLPETKEQPVVTAYTKNDFKGEFVNPQFWPENLDYTGKKVVIIAKTLKFDNLVIILHPQC